MWRWQLKTNRLDKPVWWVLGALATWRLASIIHNEGIAAPVRQVMGVDHNGSEDQEDWKYPQTFAGKLLSCFWCTSVWSGAGVVLLIVLCPPLALVLAFSAIAIWIKTRSDEGDD